MPLTRDEMARRVAQDIADGSYVNLGIGLPTLVGNHVPAGREVVYHSENGILGLGPAPLPGQEDPELINAGKELVTLLPGGAYVHHTDSFIIMRGGHLDVSVLGAFQVAANGDLANWATDDDDFPPAVGGAMDLAVGAKEVFVMMDLLSKTGESKLVKECTYPLTGLGCISRLYTDLAIFDLGPDGAKVVEMVDGLDLAELRKLTRLELEMAG